MRGKGVIGGGKFITPSTRTQYGHVNLNRFGNVTKGNMQKILSGLQSLRGLPSGAQSRQKSQYFAMKKRVEEVLQEFGSAEAKLSRNCSM